MRGTLWLIALGCGILMSSGCCGFLGRGGCGRGCGGQSCGQCDDDCGPTCGPVYGVHRERIYSDDCGECGVCPTCGGRHACDECGGECGRCCQSNFCFHPFRWIGRLFYCGTWCGPSCGEMYWGEGISDPPACHEPCDRDGHWTGHKGCASCNRGGRGGEYEGGEMSPVPEGAPVQDDLEPVPAPKTPTKAQRAPAGNYDR